MFQRKLYNYVFCVVYCLLCCVLFVVYHSTVLCQQFQMHIFSTKFNFFSLKQKCILCKLLNVFSSVVGRFLNVCMQCLVDVTESLVEPLRVWCRYVVIPLAGLSRRSAGHWRPWACHATNHKNFIYQTIVTIFAAIISNQQAINTIKKINKMFNKTIWILTFFLRDFF